LAVVGLVAVVGMLRLVRFHTSEINSRAYKYSRPRSVYEALFAR
jgi:hypothetical protein